MNNDAPVLITLDQIMSEHEGSLNKFLTAHQDACDILLCWSVTIDVKGRGQQKFLVGVAICFTELLAEEVRDQFAQIVSADAKLIFSYIPAWQYGQKDFGIYIEQTEFGDILANSLVFEVIEKADIEQTLDVRCGKAS